MGLNAFYLYGRFKLGYTPYEALAMVFVCGIINILITVTSIRRQLIAAIPETLKQAIGAGIGLFIAYIGLLNVGFIELGAGVPSITENLRSWYSIVSYRSNNYSGFDVDECESCDFNRNHRYYNNRYSNGDCGCWASEWC